MWKLHRQYQSLDLIQAHWSQLWTCLWLSSFCELDGMRRLSDWSTALIRSTVPSIWMILPDMPSYYLEWYASNGGECLSDLCIFSSSERNVEGENWHVSVICHCITIFITGLRPRKIISHIDFSIQSCPAISRPSPINKNESYFDNSKDLPWGPITNANIG